MITPIEIRQRAERWYVPFLQSWLKNESFVPYSISAGSSSADFVAFRSAVEALRRFSKEHRGYGYSIITEFRRTRSHGDQNVPVRIVLETQQDLLQLLEKEDEFEGFCQDVTRIRTSFPQLNDWMLHGPKRVIEYHGKWLDLLLVCSYLRDHPRPGMYLRELPLPVHTKFIEQHRGILQELLKHLLPADVIQMDAPTFEKRFGLREDEPLVRLRFLDNQLQTRHALLLTDIALPLSQFEMLDLRDQYCIITENKMTFLTLPSLRNTFAIFGGGFTVNNLSPVSWLSLCPILYWGDLDAQGFQILSLLRSVFPHVVSMMMDEATLQAFAQFWVPGTPCSAQQLSSLTEEEHTLFIRLIRENIRLEQERIHHIYAVERLCKSLQALTKTNF